MTEREGTRERLLELRFETLFRKKMQESLQRRQRRYVVSLRK